MELKKDILINCLYEEAKEDNIEIDHGVIEMYVIPANSFSSPMTWKAYDKNNQVTECVFFLGIQEYLKEYFKYVASRRIANKLEIELVDGKVISITPSWDQTIVDDFYANLPASKRDSHVGWYDRS